MLPVDRFYRPPSRAAIMSPGLAPGGAEIWLTTLIQRANRVDYRAIITADGGNWTNDRDNIDGIFIDRASCEAEMLNMLRET